MTYRRLTACGLVAMVGALGGCEYLSPKVDSPRALFRQKDAGVVAAVPKVSHEQAQIELDALARENREETKAAADELARELKAKQRSAEREAKRADASHADIIDDIADRYAEAAEVAKRNFLASDTRRRQAIDDIAASTQAAIDEARARSILLSDVVQLAGGAAQSSGIPGVATAGSLVLGLGGLLFGAAKRTQAKANDDGLRSLLQALHLNGGQAAVDAAVQVASARIADPHGVSAIAAARGREGV